jgi:ABC-type uncharacterized transport system permease subunit
MQQLKQKRLTYRKEVILGDIVGLFNGIVMPIIKKCSARVERGESYIPILHREANNMIMYFGIGILG